MQPLLCKSHSITHNSITLPPPSLKKPSPTTPSPSTPQSSTAQPPPPPTRGAQDFANTLRSPALPPETLKRFAALRRLLELSEFNSEFLPGLEAERREELACLPDNAPEPDLRRAFLRWKHALEIGRDVQAFVTTVEAELTRERKPAGPSTL